MTNADLYLVFGIVAVFVAAAIGIPVALRADKRAKEARK